MIVGIGFVAAYFGIKQPHRHWLAERPVSALLVDGGYHAAQIGLFGGILGL